MYRQHTLLVDAPEELRVREAVKHQYIASEFTKALITQNAPIDVATIAGRLVVACYYSGRIPASNPADLAVKTADAFRIALAIQSANPH